MLTIVFCCSYEESCLSSIVAYSKVWKR